VANIKQTEVAEKVSTLKDSPLKCCAEEFYKGGRQYQDYFDSFARAHWFFS